MPVSDLQLVNSRGRAAARPRRSIGQRSRRIKQRHYLRNLARATAAAVAVLAAAMVTGLVMNGIGTAGIIAAFFAMIGVFVLLLVFPRLRMPSVSDLRGSDLAGLTGRAEIFLETQRPALPAPAQTLVDQLGDRLDALAPQLVTLREREPAADEARRLLGEHLPGLIESYTRIPEHLRAQAHAGSTPEQQLVSGLEVISREVETMTGQIARGELDALATRGRYLETKYVEGPRE